ncbi:S26 family signal peptidase [Paracoccus onubensis]|uniref:S26 family signal peptidase n=1 Tax=Paracoccus onubensis TaxID=1675788 RepID=UPI002730AAA4|nr:S26 family signal peptidase [Paracoccus onubensis]MDP0926542.1 S26 family signal peptidase [Paracoccus onubensis]
MSQCRLTLFAMLASVALIAVPMITGHAPRLIWNASASVPTGLYIARPAEHNHRDDLVTVMPPDSLAALLDDRGYLPRGVPLIKQVAALPGAEICRTDQTISVDGHSYGTARLRDRLGRELPRWQGCRRLTEGEVFLMNRGVPDSLDGRYFGPLPRISITARLTPLWIDATGDGHFEWRASMR